MQLRMDNTTMTDVSLLVVTAHAGDELEKLGVLGAAVARNDRREERNSQQSSLYTLL